MIRYAALVLALVLVGCGTPPATIENPAPYVASDPKWSAYAPYLSRLIGRVQKQWERALVGMRHYPAAGSVVVIFIVDASGGVASISDVKNGSSKEGAQACVSAIASAAPFGDWTNDMKAVLGTQQQMTFTFYYKE